MKKIFLLSVALSASILSPARAEDADSVAKRLDALEREISAVRKENAALRQLTQLREKNAKLKATVPAVRPAVVATAAGKSDPFGAYAADLPISYKAAPVSQPRLFRVWGESGAIWSGGDPNMSAYTLGAGGLGFGGIGGLFGGGGVFNLSPKLGWEGAGGFDYRFAQSPWHISGQFRYGESGRASGLASTGGTVDASIFGGGAPGPGDLSSIDFRDTLTRNYREQHWLADLAVGKDVAGNGPDALQVKGGLRISEFVSKTSELEQGAFTYNFLPPGANLGGGQRSTVLNINSTNTSETRNSFIGAGPLIGLEGSIPLTGGWAFDYQGDAAILFGTQKSVVTTSSSTAISPASALAALGVIGGLANTGTTTTSERFASVLSADLQVGVSYWLTQNIKLGVSYRVDAMINVQNQNDPAVSNFTPDRYTHGPRVRLTGQF